MGVLLFASVIWYMLYMCLYYILMEIFILTLTHYCEILVIFLLSKTEILLLPYYALV